MLIIKLWGVPDTLSEEDLQAFFEKIFSCAKADPKLLVRSERDILVLFPADRMRHSLGSGVLVEFYHTEFKDADVEEEKAISLFGITLNHLLHKIFPSLHKALMIYPKADGDFIAG